MLKYSISVSTCDSEMLNLDVIWSCRFSSSNSSIRFLSFSDSSWEFLSSALYLYNSFCIVMISEHRLERRWKKRNENKWLKPLWNTFESTYMKTEIFQTFWLQVHARGPMYSVSDLHHNTLFMTIDGAEVVKFGRKELPGGKLWY